MLAIFALTTRCIRQGYPGLVCEMFNRANEVKMLNFLHKLEHIASSTATKTAVALGFFTHVKRTRFLGMERAQTNPVATNSA